MAFGHTLASGRVMSLIFRRSENHRPCVESNFQCSELTDSELAEYILWKESAVAPIVISTLTHGEVFATARYGDALTHGQEGEG
jgi:hypothetical protein